MLLRQCIPTPPFKSAFFGLLVVMATTSACMSETSTSGSKKNDDAMVSGVSGDKNADSSNSADDSLSPTTNDGSPAAPVDCSAIIEAGYELCDSANNHCDAVFNDSSGCSAVCASAGLVCVAAYENIDDLCQADMSLPALACDSGHQSDYCSCERTPKNSDEGGTGSEDQTIAESDCNSLSNQPFINVEKSGSGDFSTIQAALNSLSASNTTPTVIRIAPGQYYEKLNIKVPHVTLCGQLDEEENTILTYSDGSDSSNGEGGTVGTSGSASVHLSASDVSVENITFENTRGEGAQAVALLVSGERVQFKNSRFIGHQDTLYVKGGSQYFRDCYVEGTVDFIFGGATAVFDQCTIHNVGGGSAVTAPSTDENNPFGIVFLGGKLTASDKVSPGSVNLGRNWRPYGATSFIESELGPHISEVGWIKMGDNNLSTARFSEYQCTGPGANPSGRAADSKQLSSSEAATFKVETIFNAWAPSFAK